ncbi:hypothetical protein RHSA111115_04215 [Rheinheimera salexigens]
MQKSLGYTAWLIQQDTQKSTLQLSFNDNSSVLFSLLDHTTCIETGTEPETQESTLD